MELDQLNNWKTKYKIECQRRTIAAENKKTAGHIIRLLSEVWSGVVLLTIIFWKNKALRNCIRDQGEQRETVFCCVCLIKKQSAYTWPLLHRLSDGRSRYTSKVMHRVGQLLYALLCVCAEVGSAAFQLALQTVRIPFTQQIITVKIKISRKMYT